MKNLLVWDNEIITGGVETIQLNLIPALAKKFNQVIWVLPDHKLQYFKGKIKPLDNNNLTIVALGYHKTIAGSLLRNLDQIFKKIPLWKKLCSGFQRKIINSILSGLIEHFQADILFTTCIFSQPFPSVKIPVTGVLHDFNYDHDDKPEVLENMRIWVSQSSVIFTISEYSVRQIREYCPKVGGELKIVSWAVDADLDKIETPTGINPFRFIFPASAIATKGHKVLFEAFKSLLEEGVDAELILTGGGTQELLSTEPIENKDLEKARLFYHDNRHLFQNNLQAKGYLEEKKFRQLVESCSVFVLPSLKEGFGLPLLEAVCCGRSVVCSLIEPFQEQVSRFSLESIVSFFKPGDSRDLARIMHNQVGLWPDQIRLRKAKSRVLNWTWLDVAQSYFDEMQKVA